MRQNSLKNIIPCTNYVMAQAPFNIAQEKMEIKSLVADANLLTKSI